MVKRVVFLFVLLCSVNASCACAGIFRVPFGILTIDTDPSLPIVGRTCLAASGAVAGASLFNYYLRDYLSKSHVGQCAQDERAGQENTAKKNSSWKAKLLPAACLSAALFIQSSMYFHPTCSNQGFGRLLQQTVHVAVPCAITAALGCTLAA